MKKPLIAANWKLNKNPQETGEFFDALKRHLNKELALHLAFFPPIINLPMTAEKLSDYNANWGAQNVYAEVSGAFTGENSVAAIKSIGATMCLVGHSERRTLFGETDEDVAKKSQLIQKFDMIPMICLGESLVQRGSGKTEKIIGDQLLKATSLLNADKPFILAYEPVWAIGTGQVATPEMAEEAHAFLRQRLTDLFSAHKAQNTAILYGGSVKPDNVGNLIKQKNIDGFLVGGASLEVESFVQIVKSTL